MLHPQRCPVEGVFLSSYLGVLSSYRNFPSFYLDSPSFYLRNGRKCPLIFRRLQNSQNCSAESHRQRRAHVPSVWREKACREDGVGQNPRAGHTEPPSLLYNIIMCRGSTENSTGMGLSEFAERCKRTLLQTFLTIEGYTILARSINFVPLQEDYEQDKRNSSYSTPRSHLRWSGHHGGL